MLQIMEHIRSSQRVDQAQTRLHYMKNAAQQPDQKYGPFNVQTPQETALSWLYTAATRAKEFVGFVHPS